MKKIQLIAVLTLTFLFILSSEVFAKDKIEKNEMISEGKKRSYYLFVPKSVNKDKPVPLLVLLHGSGRDGRILVEHWLKLAAQESIILAGPNALDSSNWYIPKDGPQFTYDLVEELKSKHPIDPRRVYLFGHSAGAITALMLSLFESEYFAATAVSAGALSSEDYYLFDYPQRKIPVALFVGTADELFPIAKVRKTRDAFSERKFPVELTEIPFLDHNYYSKSSEINKKAWNFLTKYQLDGAPKYQQHRFKK